jgi:hypothetical protein
MLPRFLARTKTRGKELMTEMLLSEIRKSADLIQEDMQISTLNRLIQALGGELEIIAHMPGGDIHLTQFRDAA